MSTNGKEQTEEQQLLSFIKNELNTRLGIMNEVLGRSAFMQYTSGNVQDVNQECGYPSTSQLTVTVFKEFYDREPLATRVVDVLPQESWKSYPTIYEVEDPNQTTDFEQSWNTLNSKLHGNSKFVSQSGSTIWEYLRRADTLGGIGFFGVLFIGVDDGKDLSEPISPSEDLNLIFLKAFDQSNVDIVQFEIDPKNIRYGQPLYYNVEFSSPADVPGGIGLANITKKIHWSRIIHIADNISSNEIYGVPRMRPVFNRLWDLRKLYGGSAEMYWKGAFPGLSVETHPSLETTATMNVDGLRDMIEKYQLGLQRYLALNGMTANSLSPQVVDPRAHIESQIDAICIQLGIPQRIFMGSERGELASTQDRYTWKERLAFRQNNYITPRIIVPFIDRLIWAGVLPEPEQYEVEWPDLAALTKDERASIGLKNTESLARYVQGDVSMVITPIDYLTKILGISEGEAKSIVENVDLEEPLFSPEIEPGASSAVGSTIASESMAG